MILFSFFLFANSCKVKNDIDPIEISNEDTELTIANAKEVYNPSFGETNAKIGAKKRTHKERPLWDIARNSKYKDGSSAIIVPIMEEMESLSLLSLSIDSKSKKTFEELYTPVKLVVSKDKAGKIKMERMYLKADSDYAKEVNYKFNDDDFTGTIWFEDDQDNFLRAFKYDKGNLKGAFELSTKKIGLAE